MSNIIKHKSVIRKELKDAMRSLRCAKETGNYDAVQHYKRYIRQKWKIRNANYCRV